MHSRRKIQFGTFAVVVVVLVLNFRAQLNGLRSLAVLDRVGYGGRGQSLGYEADEQLPLDEGPKESDFVILKSRPTREV